MATDLLVFDCDGVLVDSEVIVIEIEADLLTAAVGGMPEFLAGLTLLRCIASSSDLDRVQLSLDVTDLTQFFDPDHVFSAQMVQNGKPSPDLFLHAATQVGIDPSDCLVIEDSPHGVTAAIAAGMRVLGFVGGQHARPSLARRLAAAGATTVIDNPQDITRHI